GVVVGPVLGGRRDRVRGAALVRADGAERLHRDSGRARRDGTGLGGVGPPRDRRAVGARRGLVRAAARPEAARRSAETAEVGTGAIRARAGGASPAPRAGPAREARPRAPAAAP